jgi:hypothetical protein
MRPQLYQRRGLASRLVLATVSALALIAVGSVSVAAFTDLDGAWRPESYVMKDGVTHEVDGLIVFSQSQWLTLFFVRKGSELERGTGEGGAFTLEGDRLTLHHHLHLSAGKALPNVPETAPLRMELRKPEDSTTEPCRIQLGGDRLTILFPSGNRMLFRRVSR